MTITEKLLAWYDSNRRDLPWRKNADPYRIWVSEIMLQQTRVQTVKPYFERWMERFPAPETLAAATEEEVLQYWQGLGYYSRARNLHQGVKEVVASYGGRVPDNREDISRLTGIGEYTAGAILSMAYNKREAAVDGNVLRVFSRLFCVEGDIAKPETRRHITALVAAELPAERPGDFNQALMDLSSALCLPQHPRCENCPLAECCLARAGMRQEELPVRRRKAPPLTVYVDAMFIKQGGTYLLRRRPAKGLLAGMWEFPAAHASSPQELPDLTASLLAEMGLSAAPLDQVTAMTHTFSHREWRLSFRSYRLLAPVESAPAGTVWLAPADWQHLTFAGPHRHMAARLEEERP